VAERVIEMMGGHFHELVEAREHVLRVILREEERFNETLDRGLSRFAEFEAAARERGDLRLRGEDAFVLHDTFGFPLDLTQVMAEEKGLEVDESGFQAAMDAQRQRSREGSRFAADDRGAAWRWFAGEPGADRAAARFSGYDGIENDCILLGVRPLDDELWEVVVDPSPFYAESGGQVGDGGRIEGKGLQLEVMDTQASGAGPVCTVRVLEGDLEAEGLDALQLRATVDASKRLDTMRNHTATHLLHRALRERLGSHATQAGSMVAPDRLRFDFHSDHGLSREELDLIERDVNQKILEDRPVAKHVDVPLEEAREMGAVAMFGEKYGDKVRVIAVDEYSVEFCGGTHCDHTGQIGLFRITGESAVQAGVRRIEAVTGAHALESFVRDRDIVRELGDELSARTEELPQRIQALKAELKSTQHELTQTRRAAAGDQATEILDSVQDVDGIRLIARQVEVAERDDLLQMGDTLRAKLGSGAAVLATEVEGKVAFLAVVTDDLIRERGLKAGELVKIPEAIAAVPAIVRELLSA
jgi:alanyl-tRNA synthetase